MKTLKLIGTAFLLTFCLTSCYNSQIVVGKMTQDQAKVKIYSKTNSHFIAGLIPVGKAVEADKVVNGKKDYMIVTNHTFVNMLLEGLTMGIYCPTTTAIYVPYE